MRVKDLGEFPLIDRIKSRIRTNHALVKGIGDDCAVLKYTADKYQLFTCDMLVAGVDFLPGEDPRLIGRKALAVSLSDIAACSGIPRHCLVSLGVPPEYPVSCVDAIYRGITGLAGEFNVNVAGGDISRAPTLFIDLSLIGEVEKKRLVLRNGAKPGDVIFVTGPLGGSIEGKHLKFTPRIRESRILSRDFKVHAMIDISDGLSQDLGHILAASSAGAVIYEGLIPLSRDCRSLKRALCDGEDFELIFTLALDDANRLFRRKLPGVVPIGYITPADCGLKLVYRSGRREDLRPAGYRHF